MVCAGGRKCIFGNVRNGGMVLNDAGRIVEFTWLDLVQHNHNIELDEFIVMPNHVHGIIIIVGAGSKPALKRDGLHNTHCHIDRLNDRAGLEPAPTC